MPMPRTKEELAQAAADAEEWLDTLDPSTLQVEDPGDLRRLGLAVIERSRAEEEVAAAVTACRDAGRSWAWIGSVLGVTRQAAQERYGESVRH